MAAWGRKPICCWNPLRVADPSSTSWSLFTPPPAISGPQLWKTFWQWPSVKLLTWKLTNLVMWYYSDLYSQSTSVCVIWVNSRERALIRETWGSVAALRGWQVTTTTSFPIAHSLSLPWYTQTHKYKSEQIHKYKNTWGSAAALRGWQVTTTAGFPHMLSLCPETQNTHTIHKYTNKENTQNILRGWQVTFTAGFPHMSIRNHACSKTQNTQISFERLAGHGNWFFSYCWKYIYAKQHYSISSWSDTAGQGGPTNHGSQGKQRWPNKRCWHNKHRWPIKP